MLFAGLLAAVSFAASAGVTVKDAWVRGTVPAQKSTGAFMTLVSSEDAKLVAASTPVAKATEMHASKMAGGMMQMHAVEAVELPAGKEVKLQPGGYHLMLLGLTGPLKEGSVVPLTLTVEDARGKRTRVEVRAELRPLGR